MTNKCNQCKKFMALAEGVKCNKCNSFFHRSCTTAGPDGGAPKKWLCTACGAPAQAKTDCERADECCQEAGDARFPYSLARELKLLRASVTREMGSVRLELSRLNTVVADFAKRVDGVEGRLAELELERAARHDLARLVERLRLELDEREQDSYANDVEIAGLEERAGEEREGEGLAGAVLRLAGELGAPLDARDVVSAERRGARRAAGAPPRPVAVRLARRAARDALLRAGRRGVERAGGRLYVNERLTAANRLLLYRAREAARRAGWRHVWTRGGRVFARRGDVASVRRVRSLLDLPALFGDAACAPHDTVKLS